MKIRLSNSFEPLLHDEHRYLVLCGGRGSGKSEFAARKIFYRCMTESGHRFLILRKVRKTCKDSVIKVFLTLLAENEIAYTYNKTDHTITWTAPGGLLNELLFDGLDEPEKIKSIKGLTGIWIEEATEFTGPEFVEVDLVLREQTPHYKQVILTFNPDEAQGPWLKKRFFDNADPQAHVHESTIDDNPIAEMREEYRRQLDGLADETLRTIYRDGKWAAPRGQIYGWDVVPLPNMPFDEVFYGLDFGYSVNPSALIRIYRRANEYWLEQIIYQSGLNNQQFAEAMIEAGIAKRAEIYADSAEPKSIDEIVAYGFNIHPAIKGPDSVRAGIDYLKAQKIHIVQGSTDIISEAGTYIWKKDRNGDPIREPVKFKDHALDAVRYGIYTHAKAADGFLCAFSEEAVY
jgi:phage terminase large subunit